MKRFDKDGKINFVDENNVYVGYDLRQDCCEDADWFLHRDRCAKINPAGAEEPDLTTFRFDPDFFEDVLECTGLDEGGMVRFRLTDGTETLYLHLYNCHNGYYGHGFTMEIGGKVMQQGTL